MGRSLSKDELLPGEDVVLNKNVNAITAPTEPGDLARSGVSLAGLSSALNLAELQQLATGAG